MVTASASFASRYTRQHSDITSVGRVGSKCGDTAAVRDSTSRRSAATSLYPPSSLYA